MWVKVDDTFPDHLKISNAGQALGREGIARAVTLFLVGLCYAGRNLTDGFLPQHAVEGMRHVGTPEKVAEALVTVGLWETAPGGFQIHDYHHYQPLAATVKQKRERDRRRKAIAPESERIPRGIVTESHAPRGTGSDLPEIKEGIAGLLAASDREARSAGRVLAVAEQILWFDKIYAIYPRKERKVEANRAWIDLAPDATTAQAIFNDVDARVRAGWKRYELRFIPQLKTYLSDRMWEDEKDGASAPFEDDVRQVPHAWQCRICGDVHEGSREQAQQRPCLKRVSA